MDFVKEFIEIPENEIQEKVHEIDTKKLLALYEHIPTENKCITLGMKPNLPFSDVFFIFGVIKSMK